MIKSLTTHFKISATVCAGAMLLMTAGCFRGRTSEKPPIHPNPNMDNQRRVEAQEKFDFFADDSAMRQPVEGTVARGWLKEDSIGPVETRFSDEPLTDDAIHAYFTGRVSADDAETFVSESPLPLSKELMKRGQDRFNIYCAACHGQAGDGESMVVKRGLLRPPAFTTERIMTMPDGQVYDIITNGGSIMPSYAHQIPVEDRWAIVSYVRALQRSQTASAEDVPAETLNELTTP